MIRKNNVFALRGRPHAFSGIHEFMERIIRMLNNRTPRRQEAPEQVDSDSCFVQERERVGFICFFGAKDVGFLQGLAY